MKHLIILASILFACGPNVKSIAQKSIEISYLSLKSAEQSYLELSRSEQETIVDNAQSKEDATASVTVYRQHQAKVVKAFIVAYATIGAAGTSIAFADTGKVSTEEIVKLALEVKSAVEQVIKLVSM